MVTGTAQTDHQEKGGTEQFALTISKIPSISSTATIYLALRGKETLA